MYAFRSLSFFAFFFITTAICAVTPHEKHITVIVPSYNVEKWYKKNLDSIFSQKYDNYSVIYINDASTDATRTLVEEYVSKHELGHRITIIHNGKNKKSLSNIYIAAYMCDDQDIIALVDGDDWLAHDHVFSELNTIYCEQDVWLTYGQFQFYPSGQKGFCRPIPKHIIHNSSYRKLIHPSHLKTFYAWLFKKIAKEDLFYEGTFFKTTGDLAIMLPMIEMSGGRFAFIPSVNYIYNTTNPINDYKIVEATQNNLACVIRNKKPYTKITTPTE